MSGNIELSDKHKTATFERLQSGRKVASGIDSPITWFVNGAIESNSSYQT